MWNYITYTMNPNILCSGNHAQALAYHGGQLDIPVTVVMPIVAPIMKVTSISTSAANRLIGEVVQSRRRPLLGPSPG